jgi:DNA-directed RNA polymerase subunit D
MRVMEVEILEERADSLRFILRDSSPAFANALRRGMLADVPVMAIEDVIFLENTSVMYDEILAHRLGLVPLRTDLDAYVPREECDCKSDLGCAKCTASFVLEAEATDQTFTVYSGDLKAATETVPTADRIPIVKLAPGQKVKLEAYARLGRGSEHAKWQAASIAAYRYMPKVTLHAENLSNPEDVIKICPTRVFASDSTRKIFIKNELECILCNSCVEQAVPLDQKKGPPVEIKGDDTTFLFNVESTGALPPKRIVREAGKMLLKKAEAMTPLVEAEQKK